MERIIGCILTFGAWSTTVASRLRDIGRHFGPAQKALFGRRVRTRHDDNCMLSLNFIEVYACSRSDYNEILQNRRDPQIFQIDTLDFGERQIISALPELLS